MAKKIFALLLAAMLVLSLAACDSKTDDSSNNGDNSNNDNSANTEVSGLTEAIAEYPALVTSGGQSADYQMIATVIDVYKRQMPYSAAEGYPVHGRDCHDGVAEGCRREKRKQLCLRRSPGRRGDARLSRERRPCACCL